MVNQKIKKLLCESSNQYRMVHRRHLIKYKKEESTKFDTKTIKWSLCHYSNAYTLVTGDISLTGNEAGISVAFKNCAPFIKRTTHINNVFLDTAKKTSTAFKYKSNITGVTEVDGADGKVTNTNIAVTKKSE